MNYSSTTGWKIIIPSNSTGINNSFQYNDTSTFDTPNRYAFNNFRGSGFYLGFNPEFKLKLMIGVNINNIENYYLVTEEDIKPDTKENFESLKFKYAFHPQGDEFKRFLKQFNSDQAVRIYSFLIDAKNKFTLKDKNNEILSIPVVSKKWHAPRAKYKKKFTTNLNNLDLT